MLYIFSEAEAFEDITLSILEAFRTRGIELLRLKEIFLDLTKSSSKDLVIMLGLNSYSGLMPYRYITYQLEQSRSNSSNSSTSGNLDKGSRDPKGNGERRTWFNDTYLQKLSNSVEIWDYSMQNIMNLSKLLKEKNLKSPRIKYVPITYLPIFSRGLEKGGRREKDIDVLFYGSINPRREKIMAELEAADHRIYFGGYNLWQEDRISLVSRAKIVLNIHFYEEPILETTRLAPLVSQGAFVISEPSTDRLLDKFWSSMVTFCPYEKIVEKVANFLQIYDSCEQFAKSARVELSKFPYLDKVNLETLPYQENAVLIEGNENAVQIEEIEEIEDQEIEEIEDQEIEENAAKIDDSSIQEDETVVPEKKDRERGRKKIRKANCKREDTEDGGKAEVLELINISEQNLPNVTIVTPTFNRSELLPIALRNFRKTIYPEGKLEWIVLDDSNELHRIKNRELLQGDIRIKYIELEEKTSISEKRNYLVYRSNSDYIVHMDDDDYYYPESVMARIKLLLKYKSEGIRCVGCTEIGIYHLMDNYSYLMDCGSYLSEASMAYHRSFWEERPFPSDRELAKMSSKTGEGALFIEGRFSQIIDMPFIFNFIAITHKKNVTGKLRTYNLDREAKNNGTNFFNLWDIDTQLFFIKLSRNSRKSS